MSEYRFSPKDFETIKTKATGRALLSIDLVLRTLKQYKGKDHSLRGNGYRFSPKDFETLLV